MEGAIRGPGTAQTALGRPARTSDRQVTTAFWWLLHPAGLGQLRVLASHYFELSKEGDMGTKEAGTRVSLQRPGGDKRVRSVETVRASVAGAC